MIYNLVIDFLKIFASDRSSDITSRDVYLIRFSNTPFPIAALFDFMEKLAIPRKRKVFDILQ